ncbi:hypothetical protein [Plebeiibacterium sediminum]|uniref:Uncharacterized protein n=1 Tax=Plebeiibacterium sediminum TaxID=2992112 RepID=A0AAE3M0P7_9BACT|nr:hypothetical protein [Plebeiobacterium sediminum]MCW3784942.1 hypothetical protein [Plebeiobacterium sediminum]
MQTVSSETSLYFAGKENRIEFEAVISEPAYTPVKLNLYVMMWGGTTEIKKSLTPTQSGTDYKATFDINNVLSGELFTLVSQRVYAFPGDPDEPMIDRTDLMMLDFYLDWSYTYIDDNGDVYEAGRTDNAAGNKYKCIYGGISRVMQYYLLGEELTFLSWLNNEDTALKFLSWIPNELPIHPSQPLRLWFYNDNKLDEVNLKLKAYFSDGTESSIRSIRTLAVESGLIELACGPLEMRVSTIDITKTVSHYDVWLENSDGTIKTEVKTFAIDYTNYERNDVLFFRNSLGVNEVIWCHGRRSESIKTTTEERTQPLADNLVGDGQIRSYRATLEYPFEMNTGYFPKSMRHYLADFLSAGEAKLPVKFFKLPVIVKPGEFDWGKDGEDLFSVSFKIQVAHIENFYSPVPDVESPWGDFNNDFNEDFF